MVRGQHEDDALTLVNTVEKPVIADAISPGLGHGIPKLLDVLPEVWVLAKLGIDGRDEFALDARLLPTEILVEVFLELRGFEDAELSQRAYPSDASRHGARPEVSS